MKSILPALLVLAFSFSASASGAVARQSCQFTRIKLMKKGSRVMEEKGAETLWEGVFGGFSILLSGDESGASFVKATVTPLNGGKGCSLDLDDAGYTQALYGVSKSLQLYFPKEYGSGDEVRVFDLKTCRKQDVKLEIDRARFTKDSIVSDPVCESGGLDGACDCSDARVYTFDANCKLVFHAKKSQQVTQEFIKFGKGSTRMCSDSPSRGR